jgi:hypothetical protein
LIFLPPCSCKHMSYHLYYLLTTVKVRTYWIYKVHICKFNVQHPRWRIFQFSQKISHSQLCLYVSIWRVWATSFGLLWLSSASLKTWTSKLYFPFWK